MVSAREGNRTERRSTAGSASSDRRCSAVSVHHVGDAAHHTSAPDAAVSSVQQATWHTAAKIAQLAYCHSRCGQQPVLTGIPAYPVGYSGGPA